MSGLKAMSCWDSIDNVVASCGTALTEAQGRLLRKYAEEVIISYDSDSAGQAATLRGLEILNNLGCDIRILQMEGAKDPDEYILKNGINGEDLNLLIGSIPYDDKKVTEKGKRIRRKLNSSGWKRKQ